MERIVTIIVCMGILFTGLGAVAIQRGNTQTEQFPEISGLITGLLNVGFTVTGFAIFFVATAGILFTVFAYLASQT